MRFSFPQRSVVTETIDIDPGITVAIGMPAHAPINVRTFNATIETVQQLCQMKIGHAMIVHQSNVVTLARDAVLMRFLDGDCQKLFWIDSDMVWDVNAFLTMLALSQHVDVVGASYPAKTDRSTFFINCDAHRKIGPYGLQEFKGYGLGFTVVDRAICQALSDRSPAAADQIAGRLVPSVFRIDLAADGTRRTEDMAFFQDIRDMGHTVWCKTDLKLGHVGEHMWTGDLQSALDSGNITYPKEA